MQRKLHVFEYAGLTAVHTCSCSLSSCRSVGHLVYHSAGTSSFLYTTELVHACAWCSFFLFRLICFCTMFLCITLLDFFYYCSARFFNHCWIMFLTTAFVFVLPLYYGFCAATLLWFLYYNMLLCQILFLCVLPQLFSLATGLAHINRARKSCDQQ